MTTQVTKYREKQMKESHPANRPLPPVPPSTRNISTPHLTSPRRLYTSSPFITPQTSPYRAFNNGARPLAVGQLPLVPEDTHPPPPPPWYGSTMEEDMRSQYSSSSAAGNRYDRPNGIRNYPSSTVANGMPPPRQYGTNTPLLLLSLLYTVYLSYPIFYFFPPLSL